jgi:CheY-like chemotaxis protein
LGALAGGIAHDFNNLLVAVLGNAGLVELELEELELGADSKSRRFVREIERAAVRAATLADQLLAYARGGGGPKLALELNRLVKEAVGMFTAVLDGDTIELELAADLPVFEGDPNQIAQALIHVIANATDTLRGDGSVEVGTRLETLDAAALAETRYGRDLAQGDYVTVEIVAIGGGAADTLERRIFDPFVSTEEVGRDLGMACVLGVVRRHKGTIDVLERADGAMSVRLRFPAARETGDADAPQPASNEGLAPPSATAGTILVVDEEEAIRTLAKSALELSGFEVLTAASGDDAIELYRKHGHRVDVTLLDVTKSDTSGEATLEQLRELGAGPSVIVSSGVDADVMRRFEGIECAFLEKPYRPFALVAKVLEIVEHDANSEQ